MSTIKTIHVISAHAEGEVGDVIIKGVEPPPGKTLWEQSRWIAKDQTLRNFMLNEPRGGVFRHVNLLVPPVNSKAQAAFIIMEPEDTPPMSGSNSMCVATVLLNHGLISMEEPVTNFFLEAPGGLVEIKAFCNMYNKHINVYDTQKKGVINFVDDERKNRKTIDINWNGGHYWNK